MFAVQPDQTADQAFTQLGLCTLDLLRAKQRPNATSTGWINQHDSRLQHSAKGKRSSGDSNSTLVEVFDQLSLLF